MKKFFSILATVIFSLFLNAQDKGYVHIATAENTAANWTYIDHPDLNGNPDARFLFSQRYNDVDNNHPTGVWYASSQWAIFNEDLAPMPEGVAFNIYIPDDSTVDVHIANVSGHQTELSGYTGGNFLFHNNYYNPNYVYNPLIYGNYFNGSNRWIYEEEFNTIPNDAAFLVMLGSDISATMTSQSSNAENIDGSSLTIDHPLLNDNPDAVFLFSHYYGYPDGSNSTYLPYVTETYYYNNRWHIYAYGALSFPEDVWIDIIIPDTILGTDDVQQEFSKISVYPNPVVDKVNINSSKETIHAVEIYNVSGKLVQSFKETGKSVSLDVTGLPTGMYIAKVKTDEGWFSRKLIKK